MPGIMRVDAQGQRAPMAPLPLADIVNGIPAYSRAWGRRADSAISIGVIMRAPAPQPEDLHSEPAPLLPRPQTGRTGVLGRKAEKPRDGAPPAGPSGQRHRLKDDRHHTNS